MLLRAKKTFSLLFNYFVWLFKRTEEPKILSESLVRKFARKLMAQKGEVTTLDVKTQIRNLGIIAFQYQVSQLLSIVANQEKWAITDNGSFRIYRKSN